MALLSFPSDRAVGTLDWNGSWSAETGPVFARGDVEVPDGADVRLDVREVLSSERSGDGWAMTSSPDPVDLGFLAELPPDVLRAVTIGAADERSFPALTRLAPGLRQLYLAFSDLTDAVLPTVAALTGLTWLQTFGNRFSDDGVQQLVTLTELRELFLEEATLTSAGFAFVDRLPHLQQLGVQDVDLDDADLDVLRARLPGVRVDR